MRGDELIRLERERQIEGEQFTTEHDDDHDRYELVKAAICYADHSLRGSRTMRPLCDWPWNETEFKPSIDPLHDLVKAGALIAAEIDRIQRKRKKDSALRRK